jgi:hypothetical protein
MAEARSKIQEYEDELARIDPAAPDASHRAFQALLNAIQVDHQAGFVDKLRDHLQRAWSLVGSKANYFKAYLQTALRLPVFYNHDAEVHAVNEVLVQQLHTVLEANNGVIIEDLNLFSGGYFDMLSFLKSSPQPNYRDIVSTYAKVVESVSPQSVNKLMYVSAPTARSDNSIAPKLRVGFIGAYMTAETRQLFASVVLGICSLKAFTTILFVQEHETAGPAAQHADSHVALPVDINAARRKILDEEVDVLVYTGLQTFWGYQLAIDRLAQVQIGIGGPASSGSIDYYVTSELFTSEFVTGLSNNNTVGLSDRCHEEQIVRFETLALLPPLPPYAESPNVVQASANRGPYRKMFGFGESEHIYVFGNDLQTLTTPHFDTTLLGLLCADPAARIIFAASDSRLFAKLKARWQRSQNSQCTTGQINFSSQMSIIQQALTPEQRLMLFSVADCILDQSKGDMVTVLDAFAIG